LADPQKISLKTISRFNNFSRSKDKVTTKHIPFISLLDAFPPSELIKLGSEQWFQFAAWTKEILKENGGAEFAQEYLWEEVEQMKRESLSSGRLFLHSFFQDSTYILPSPFSPSVCFVLVLVLVLVLDYFSAKSSRLSRVAGFLVYKDEKLLATLLDWTIEGFLLGKGDQQQVCLAFLLDCYSNFEISAEEFFKTPFKEKEAFFPKLKDFLEGQLFSNLSNRLAGKPFS